jgi:hypothetical protein
MNKGRAATTGIIAVLAAGAGGAAHQAGLIVKSGAKPAVRGISHDAPGVSPGFSDEAVRPPPRPSWLDEHGKDVGDAGRDVGEECLQTRAHGEECP